MRQERETRRAHPGAVTDNSIFRREGEYWTIAYGGIVCRLRDTAGLRCLAFLLGRPGARVAALELVRAYAPNRAQGRRTTTRETELARVSVTRSIRAAMRRITTHNASLVAHLRATIKTGAHCSYAPDPRLPVPWHL
jgi:hypothetical protein